jgi:hypothetical protein
MRVLGEFTSAFSFTIEATAQAPTRISAQKVASVAEAILPNTTAPNRLAVKDEVVIQRADGSERTSHE